MNTKLSYFEDTYKFKDLAMIRATGKDESGPFIILNQTIFYPQGGGQPSDSGKIEVDSIDIPIHTVKCINSEIRHYTDQDYSYLVGHEAVCYIDHEKRLLHARLHTSGHLISNIIEKLYPHWQAVKGHHFPDQCYVEFSSKKASSEDISPELVQKEIEHFVKQDCLLSYHQVSGPQLREVCPNIPYAIPSDQLMRIIRIGDFPFSPCGGTHVKSLKEIEGLEITKYKIKNKSLKINYHITRD